jgi:hypothetical protein
VRKATGDLGSNVRLLNRELNPAFSSYQEYLVTGLALLRHDNYCNICRRHCLQPETGACRNLALNVTSCSHFPPSAWPTCHTLYVICDYPDLWHGSHIHPKLDRPLRRAKLLPRHVKEIVEEIGKPAVKTNSHNGNQSMEQAFSRSYRNIRSA